VISGGFEKANGSRVRKLSATWFQIWQRSPQGTTARPLSLIFMYQEIISQVIVPVIGLNPSAFATIIAACHLSSREKNATFPRFGRFGTSEILADNYCRFLEAPGVRPISRKQRWRRRASLSPRESPISAIGRRREGALVAATFRMFDSLLVN
jgi:hypothetical protein